MADISDVEKAIARTLRAKFFPNQSVRGDTLATSNILVVGQPVSLRIARGWPNPDALDASIADNGCVVSVYTEGGMMRDTTRFQAKWRLISKTPILLSAALVGDTITFAGTATAGQYVGVGIGHTGWTHVCTDNDTPASIALALASQIGGATANGSQLVISTSEKIAVVCDSDTIVTRELARQTQAFCVNVWAPNDRIRDAVGAAVVQAMQAQRVLSLADGSITNKPRLLQTWNEDATQKSKVWRRWSRFEIEFATTEVLKAPPVLHVGVNNDEEEVGRFSPDGPI